MGRLSNEEKQRRAAAATTPAPEAGAVNPNVLRMTGHNSEEEMAASLPDNTNASSDEAPTRKKYARKPKIEAPSADPLLEDRRYARAVGKATFLGGAKAVKGGFKLAATMAADERIALDSEECEDVEDYFYALGKRRSLGDPFATWWMSLIYFFVMMGTLVGTRFAAIQGEEFQGRLARVFGFGKEEKESEPENGKV